MEKPILNWTSKIQIKKGTPMISLIKHIREMQNLYKGKVLHCYLYNEEKRVYVKIYLDGIP